MKYIRMMAFKSGEQVRFLHTGEIGKVLREMGDGVVEVELLDGDVIPVLADSIISIYKPPPPASSLLPKPLAPSYEDYSEEDSVEESAEEEDQIFLAYEADSQSTTPRYIQWLVNKSDDTLLFSYKLEHPRLNASTLRDKVGPYSAYELGFLSQSMLSEAPQAQLEYWPISGSGSSKGHSSHIRLKPKTFYPKLTLAPLLNRPAYCFSLEAVKRRNSDIQELKEHTIANLGSGVQSEDPLYAQVDVAAYAHFQPELDLHIEALTPLSNKMSAVEILRYQLQCFDEYLQKAIELGLDRVYIIHGVGTGKLRNAIAQRLKKNPDVFAFKNEHHPKYGYGATEVNLK